MTYSNNSARPLTDCAERGFPEPAFAATDLLQPLRSWHEVYAEMRVTGIEFDACWYQAVMEGTCVICRWLGEPRATILVVFSDDELSRVECMGANGRVMTMDETAQIDEELMSALYSDNLIAPPTLH